MSSARAWAGVASLLAIASLATLSGGARSAPPARSKLASQAPNSSRAASKKPVEVKDAPSYLQQAIRGRAVWLEDALQRRFRLPMDASAAHTQVVLETANGELHPILRDARGRAFHLDERWRDIDLEVLARRYKGSPYLQVIRLYTLKPEGKFELDYWCDVCAISLFELKPCDCCQGEIRIRERLVKEDAAP